MMHQFGLAPEELERRGAALTAREIAQQPEVWRSVESLVASEAGRVAAFLEPLLRRPQLRILLTGAGTSAFIGECLAPALVRHRGLRASAVATTELVAGPAGYLGPPAPTLLISFARSGNSPESTAAVELLERLVPDCHHLILTCNADGELYRCAGRLAHACVLLLPEATHDRAFAMTSSFSSMLLASARLLALPLSTAAAVGGPPAEELLRLWQPRIHGLVAAGFERIIYLGSHELKGLAREAALKMLELSDGRVVSLAETPLGFRHGPKTIVNSRTLVVMLLSNDPYTRLYDLDLLAELRADRIAGRVLALAGRHGGSSGHPDDVLIPGLAEASDLGLCLPFVMFAQSLALQQSLALGIRSDTPNAAGAVSRVVRGVSIHPLEPGV